MAQRKKQVRNRILLASLAVLALHAEDAGDIFRRSQEREADRFDRLKDYTYTMRVERQIYNLFGKLRSRDVKTYEFLVSNGRPYVRVTGKDDKPLPEREARREQARIDRALARLHPPSADARRQYLDGFRYYLDEVQEFDGRPAWVVNAAGISNRTHIKRWIDQATYQVVKYEREDKIGSLTSRVSSETVQVGDDVWLPSHLILREDGSLPLQIHLQMEVTYKNYKKFQTDSHFVPIGEPGR